MDFNVGVIGAGAFGSAISQQLSKNLDDVLLLLRNENLCEDINEKGYNTKYYPNVKLNDNIKATLDIIDLKDCDVIFLTIPSSAYRSTLDELKEVAKEGVILVTTAKGIEYPSLKTMSKIIGEYPFKNIVALSGPNFASEIMLNLPSITNIASNDIESSRCVKEILETKQFKVKIIDDIKGIELCGILKNINAIANGICEGLNINENARFAVLTKGFNDTIKIIEAVGGKSQTVKEYCGFGDLILTSTSNESRNHTLGVLYGQRLIINENASGIVFEGKNSIKAIRDICIAHDVESCIVDFVYEVIIEKITPIQAFNKLWDKLE